MDIAKHSRHNYNYTTEIYLKQSYSLHRHSPSQ